MKENRKRFTTKGTLRLGLACIAAALWISIALILLVAFLTGEPNEDALWFQIGGWVVTVLIEFGAPLTIVGICVELFAPGFTWRKALKWARGFAAKYWKVYIAFGYALSGVMAFVIPRFQFYQDLGLPGTKWRLAYLAADLAFFLVIWQLWRRWRARRAKQRVLEAEEQIPT